jgi:hypothetical protein
VVLYSRRQREEDLDVQCEKKVDRDVGNALRELGYVGLHVLFLGGCLRSWGLRFVV